MRKLWLKVFLLCMACMICMGGLCMAKENGENWVRYYRSDYYTCKVDTNSIKVRECDGRKYLEANIHTGGAKMLLALDIENQKFIILEGFNRVTGKKMDIHESQLSQQSSSFPGVPMCGNLITWVEKNRPEVINEIREHNKTAPPLPAGTPDVSGPQSNTAVDSAPGVAPSATISTADIEYEILDSGAVKYEMRTTFHESVQAWLSPGGPYYIFRMPESLKKERVGDYVIGYWHYPHETYVRHVEDTWEYADKEYDAEEEEQNKQLWGYAQFSYDPKTDMFTFYDGDYYGFRLRLIDRNTVYAELLEFEKVREHPTPRLTQDRWSDNLAADYTAVFKYVPLSSLTAKEMEIVNKNSVIADMNDCVWFRDHPCELTGKPSMARQNLFTAYVDMMLAFKAVNGKIGDAPEGYEIAEWK